jgi:hypothetical protein
MAKSYLPSNSILHSFFPLSTARSSSNLAFLVMNETSLSILEPYSFLLLFLEFFSNTTQEIILNAEAIVINHPFFLSGRGIGFEISSFDIHALSSSQDHIQHLTSPQQFNSPNPNPQNPPPSLYLITPKQRHRIRINIHIRRIPHNTRAPPINHTIRTHRIQIINIDIRARVFDAEDFGLAVLAVARVGAGFFSSALRIEKKGEGGERGGRGKGYTY